MSAASSPKPAYELFVYYRVRADQAQAAQAAFEAERAAGDLERV